MVRTWIAVLALGALPTLTHAQGRDWTVEAVMHHCERGQVVSGSSASLTVDDALDIMQCVALLRGVVSALTLNCYEDGRVAGSFGIAPPPSGGAGIQAFINWARDNPASWGDDAAWGMTLALMDEFPCEAP